MSGAAPAAPSGTSPRLAEIVGPIALVTLCALGAAVSGLSTWDHVRFRVSGSTQASVCAALVDSGCMAAHSSVASEVLGVPISHFGSAFYLAVAGLAVVALVLRKRHASTRVVTAGIAPVVALMGLAAVAYSVFLATLLIRYGEACPFCIALYGVNAAVLVVGVVWWLRGQRRVSLRSLLVPSAIAVGVGGGFLAATTPFLLDALCATTSLTVAGTANPGGKMLPPFALPARIASEGSPTAEDGLVEFSDLECPHCAVLYATVASLFEERGPTGLRVRFVNYPLDPACNPHVARPVHPTACLSARAGICAQEQGRFWPFAEASFALQGPRSRAAVLDTAREVGLDMDRFAECLDAEHTVRALAEDIALAHAAGVRATPTILVNGWTFEGAIPRARLLQVLGDTTPCGCDQRSPDGICGPATDAASPSALGQP
jgi:predicted DsbA family dithiol-disulfide isomerase/uncharacterized membrane protein